MSFNAQKSHLVRFSRLRKAAPVAVRLRSEILTEEPMLRYLGLTMDAKLNYVSHVQDIKRDTSIAWLLFDALAIPTGALLRMLLRFS